MTTQPTPKGTFPITPETKIPFPCWLWSTGKAAYANGDGWVFIEAPYWKCDIQHTMFTHYSTNAPDDKPEDVETEQGPGEEDGPWSPGWEERSKPAGNVVVGAAPHPTLEQLAEKAVKELDALADAWDNHATPYSQSEMAAIILRHFSPEWEQMVRERDKYVRLYEEEETMRRNANKNNVALRAEVQRLVADKESFVKLFDANPSALWSQVATLRAEVERLTKEMETAELSVEIGDHRIAGLQNGLNVLRARVRELEKERDDAIESRNRAINSNARLRQQRDERARLVGSTARK